MSNRKKTEAQRRQRKAVKKSERLYELICPCCYDKLRNGSPETQANLNLRADVLLEENFDEIVRLPKAEYLNLIQRIFVGKHWNSPTGPLVLVEKSMASFVARLNRARCALSS